MNTDYLSDCLMLLKFLNFIYKRCIISLFVQAFNNNENNDAVLLLMTIVVVVVVVVSSSSSSIQIYYLMV